MKRRKKPSAAPPSPASTGRGEAVAPLLLRLVVTCANEQDQKALYERMTAEGRRCRVLTL